MLFTLQRYEFLSKSQRAAVSPAATEDVVYLTKVRIFKQITTCPKKRAKQSAMLFTLQRYEFLSKSQPLTCRGLRARRCCLPYKGTNF